MIPLIIGGIVGYFFHDILHRQSKRFSRWLRHKTAAAQTKRWARRK